MKLLNILFSIIFLLILFACTKKNSLLVNDGFITTKDGIQLYYQNIGKGSDIIIIPSGMYLADAFKQLANQNRTVLFYDQRGRGRSDAISDKSKLGIKYEINDLESIRQYFGFEKVFLVGWSYSGAVVALYTIDHPGYVKRVVQICPIPPRKDPYWNQFISTLSSRKDSSDQDRLNEITKRFRETGNLKAYIKEYFKVSHKAQKYDNGLKSRFREDFYTLENERPDKVWNFILPSIISSFSNWDFREKLGYSAIPFLTIHGDYDAIPLDSAREWSQLLPNGRLLIVRNSGHFPWLEQPDLFFKGVNCFLNGEWPNEAEDLNM